MNSTHRDLTGRKGLDMSLDVERDSVRVPQRVGFGEQMRSMKNPKEELLRFNQCPSRTTLPSTLATVTSSNILFSSPASPVIWVESTIFSPDLGFWLGWPNLRVFTLVHSSARLSLDFDHDDSPLFCKYFSLGYVRECTPLPTNNSYHQQVRLLDMSESVISSL
jgi:hypothetical protein